jgi:hypothetical protein
MSFSINHVDGSRSSPFQVSGFARVAFGLALVLVPASRALCGTGDPDFEKEIAPALIAKCVSCHKADNAKGKFDLTTREGMLRGGSGGPGLVPGKAEESPIYTRSVPDEDGTPPEMPAKGDPLTASEAEALRAWIAAGAEWPMDVALREKAKADASFWSLRPIAVVGPPDTPGAPEAWAKGPVDRFVYAKLSENGLKPNPPAAPRTFIRRATYDLTGLPPTPEEVDAFVKECGESTGGSHGDLPDAAVERLIDRLLASPRYGERWGRHWLDVVRFGESIGYERNQIITTLWPFRDYVIMSFNDDKPFDRFIIEHLAGDVVGKDDPEVEIGSAFLVAGPYDDVGNQDAMAAAQIRADQMDEMIRATSESFLGVTLGCARCHDHKFDPLTSRDYYSMYATFSGTVHGEREVATAEARRMRAEALAPLQDQRGKLSARKAELEKALAERAKASEEEASQKWTRPRASRYGTEEVFGPVTAGQVRLTVDGTDAADPNQKRFKIDEFEVWTAGDQPRNVALASEGATAIGKSHEASDIAGAYGAQLTIDGRFGARWFANDDELIIKFARPETIGRVLFSSDRARALGESSDVTVFVGDYTIDVSSDDGKTWTTVASSADRAPSTETRKQARLKALSRTKEDDAKLAEATKALAQVDAAIARVPGLPVWWVGTHRPQPGPFHVFIGGSPQRKGDQVLPASLEVLERATAPYRLTADSDEGQRRLTLAKWIVDPKNPLTPRVLANRVWHYHFGTGIVDTPSDFGFLGGRPSHPELLDWLANELMRQGWKLKPVHRLIMTSQTYRQASTWREEAAQADAGSRLLWRFPPHRLDAEAIRDTMLDVAGKLDLTMGGPGFRLYEYQQDNVATYVPLDTHGPATYRRAVYHHNARSSRVDVMTDFDCPDPAFAEARRASTVTPLQALTLMNHPFALDMAEALAERLEREASDTPARIRRAFELTFGRDPTDAESSGAVGLIEKHGLRAFCRVLMNSNEMIHIN